MSLKDSFLCKQKEEINCVLLSRSSLTQRFSSPYAIIKIKFKANQLNQQNQLSIARYKKAMSTAIRLQLTLVACYLPLGGVTSLATSGERSLYLFNAWFYAVTLAYLNSSLNAILYCCKP